MKLPKNLQFEMLKKMLEIRYFEEKVVDQYARGAMPDLAGRGAAAHHSQATHSVLGQVLGAHILGDHATDLIGGLTLALNLETTIDELGRTIQAHPTLFEAISEAALDAARKAIHLPKKWKKRIYFTSSYNSSLACGGGSDGF